MSFAYAERAEDAPEQIVCGECSRDLFQCLLTEAQFLGDELAGAPLLKFPCRSLDAFAGSRQCLQMSTPRGNTSVTSGLKADTGLQVRAQRLHALTRHCGHVDARWTGERVFHRQACGKVYLVE